MVVGGGLQDLSVSLSPLGTNLGFERGWTWLGTGLGGLGIKGLGPGPDNTSCATSVASFKDLNKSPTHSLLKSSLECFGFKLYMRVLLTAQQLN